MEIFSLLGIWEIYQLKVNKRNEAKQFAYFEREVENGHKEVKENFYHTSNMVRNSWKNKYLYLKR